MTNQEFWNQLEVCVKSEPDKIPSLVLQANQENLCILIVVNSNVMHALELDHKFYVHCVTSKDVPLPAGYIIREFELKGLFFSLIESGLNGMIFASKSNMVGFGWKDLFQSPDSQTPSASSK